jgi:trans-2,3-dihydro-3-hydroxyanthranilate isomerase
MKLDYRLLDVFTTTPLAGNQLAVVLNADSLLDNQMQAIAVEFGLSETVFLCKPQLERHTAAVRIFTSTRELPFAGHPTIGAAVVLALQHRLTAVRIEEQVGMVTCLVDKIDKRTAHARFALPQLPEEAGKSPGKAALALALGLNPEDLGCGEFQPAVYSAGVLYYLVPVRNADVLAKLRLDLTDWAFTFPLGNHAVYCFTRTEGEEGIDFAARMFAPGMGSGEDAGTGSAAAALIGLLAQHTSFADGQVEYQIRQGKEMGRLSRISVQLRKDAGVLSHGSIGGHAVIIGEGAMELSG